MTFVDAIFESDVEPCDFVTPGENGILKIARFGDMVVGKAVLSITNEKMMLQEYPTFKPEGTWVYDFDSNIERFYKDKFTPTNKYRKFYREDIEFDNGCSVEKFSEIFDKYCNDDKPWKVYNYEPDEFYVGYIEEWEE